MDNQPLVVYCTCPDQTVAEHIAETTVSERLAACVNLAPGLTSIYRWEGEIVEDTEAILIAKTPYHNIKNLTDRVKDLHSYECPCIISLQLTEQEGNEEYQKWLLKNSQKQEIDYEVEDV